MRIGTLVFMLALVSFARAAHAQCGPLGVHELGDGMWVQRVAIRRGRSVSCDWRAGGVDVRAVINATEFAAAGGARVVAFVPGGASFTDDRGAHWTGASWDGAETAVAGGFDAASSLSVAGGTGGTIWTSDDRGEHWRRRRAREYETIVQIATAGTALAFVTNTGAVGASTDGGTSFETVFDSTYRGDVFVVAQSDAVLVMAGARVIARVERGGVLRLSVAP